MARGPPRPGAPWPYKEVRRDGGGSPGPRRGPAGHGAGGAGSAGALSPPRSRPAGPGAAVPPAGMGRRALGQDPCSPSEPALSVCACAANPGPPGSPQERRWGEEEQEAREGAQAKWQGH